MKMAHTNHKDVVSQTHPLGQGDRVPSSARILGTEQLLKQKPSQVHQVHLIFSNLTGQAMVASVTQSSWYVQKVGAEQV